MNETCLHVAHQSEEIAVPVPRKSIPRRGISVMMPMRLTGVFANRGIRVQHLSLTHERLNGNPELRSVKRRDLLVPHALANVIRNLVDRVRDAPVLGWGCLAVQG